MTVALGESFPLDWPVGYPRTHSRSRAPYKATAGRARDQVIRELRLMGVPDWNVIISTNCPISSRTSQFLVMRSEPSDTGVAVYFRKEEKPYVLACDRWDHVADNLRAIALTLEAMRGMDRWGVSEMLERVFQGFTALPAPEDEAAPRSWWEVLGVSRIADLDYIEERYRALLKTHHPDAGGSHAIAAEVNRAIEMARLERGGAR
jgi:hypothetical protein